MSPLIDQVFFIGDGLTGDGTGVSQHFNVPAGASLLYLGISDSGEFNGRPLEYWDNLGTFTIGDSASPTTAAFTETAAATAPEPSTLGTAWDGCIGDSFRGWRCGGGARLSGSGDSKARPKQEDTGCPVLRLHSALD